MPAVTSTSSGSRTEMVPLPRVLLLLLAILQPAWSAPALLATKHGGGGGGDAFPAALQQPHQLQVNYQRSPSLGVGPTLRFSWAVPHAVRAAAVAAPSQQGMQRSYSIVVTDAATHAVAWKSGLVESAESINIALHGPGAGLRPGAAYTWTVACDGGAASEPAAFVTALWDGFDPAARWVWASDVAASQHYANLRSTAVKAAASGKQIETALLFVTAWQEPTMLASYTPRAPENLGKAESRYPGNGLHVHMYIYIAVLP